MHLNELNRKIVKQVLNHPASTAEMFRFLTTAEQDRAELERRVANTYINACYTAHTLGIENVEEIISRRIGELALQE